MHRITIHILLALMSALLFTACSYRPNDFSDFRDIPPAGWNYVHPFTFTPHIQDSVATGTLVLAVRHTNEYPFRNLYVEVSYLTPDSITHRDTVNVMLADVYGNWLGSGLGTSFQKADTISRSFQLMDSTAITLRHVMRPDPVTGLEQIGLLFTAQ